jgi:glycosyltransferase involved in cell wall biosynthesis
MRIVMCWGAVSGYMAACWRALAARPDIDLFVITHAQQSDTAFDAKLMAGLNYRAIALDSPEATGTVRQILRDRNAQVLTVPGWVFSPLRKLVLDKDLGRLPVVMGMDTPLRLSWRQQFGRIRLHRYLSRIDCAVVAGERAFQLACYLGLPERKIRRGVYGFDHSAFTPVLERRMRDHAPWPRRFLYVGRYIESKGIDVLIAAYELYRKSSSNPWPLTCCGSGPLGQDLAKVSGVEDLGFQQPADLPAIFARSGVFVLPSRYEPWGVVIAEAAGAGLPVLCTEACGASVELVRSRYNGLTFPTGDPQELAKAFRWAEDRYDQLPLWGQRSQQLAAPFSAEAWAERWMGVFTELAQ